MICDVSKWQGEIDWAALAEHVDYVAIKASGKTVDLYYLRNVEGAVANGVRFHAFHFLYCLTEAEARRDAAMFYDTVSRGGHWPLFWVLDCEGGWGIEAKQARPVAEAFEAELRRLALEQGPGEIRVAVYIGQNRYYEYALDYDHYAYIWIPGYGEKWRPKMYCDVWQYTDKGTLPGIRGDVDLDMLIGNKPLSFFISEEEDEMASVYVYGASIDENGNAHGGKAGNQTGKELRKQKWYQHSKGWRVFRAKNPGVAAKIATAAKAAVANMHIGYDQYQRNTLYAQAAKVGFDPAKVTVDCETDCSALVRVCCAYAGIIGLPEGFRTTNEPKNLLATGAFIEMVGDKYTRQAAFLKAGDILCTPVQGHTVVVGNDGPNAETTVYETEGLKRGDFGTAVTVMQNTLLAWNPACLPKFGTDGDFGKETEDAVKAYQAAAGLPVTGVYNEATRKSLYGLSSPGEPATGCNDDFCPIDLPRTVKITGNSVNVRSGPGTKNTRILGVAHKGDSLIYQGETRSVDGRDWYMVEFAAQNGWVSSKYSEIV